MPEFVLDKLVRDKIPEKIASEGHEIESRRLRGALLLNALAIKMTEESREVLEAINDGDREKILGEVADAMAVIKSLVKNLGFSLEEVEEAMAAKEEKSGAFDDGMYAEKVRLKPDGLNYEEWLKYYRAEPRRYTEVD